MSRPSFSARMRVEEGFGARAGRERRSRTGRLGIIGVAGRGGGGGGGRLQNSSLKNGDRN